MRDARLEAGWAQRMRHARARLEIIISEEVVLVVWLRPLGADAVVEGVVAIPVGSVVVIVVVVVIVRPVRSEAHLDRHVPVVAWHVSTNEGDSAKGANFTGATMS